MTPYRLGWERKNPRFITVAFYFDTDSDTREVRTRLPKRHYFQMSKNKDNVNLTYKCLQKLSQDSQVDLSVKFSEMKM